ncbi:MAG: hypothetical protein ABEK29_00040 [Bradymonadaceae bacterium]
MWPLLLIALAMGTVGYYLALSSPEPQLEHRGAYGIERSEPIDPEAVADDENVTLQYGAGPERSLQLAIDQSHRAGDSEMTTQIDLDLSETRESVDGGIEYTREYEQVGVSMQENGRPVDAEIAAQIESLLVGTRAVSTVSSIGRPKTHEWRSVTNPQVRQTLYILRHATRLLTPHLRRDAVNPGDSWSYTLPAKSVADSQFVESLDGKVRVRMEYVGTVERDGRRLAVLDRSIELSGGGEIQLEEEPGPRWFELSGQGSGRVLFDIERGMVVESRVNFERTLELQGPEGETRKRKGQIELYLREAPKNGS